MKNKYSQDEKTAEMVDLVVENAVFDFSFMYGVYREYPAISVQIPRC